MDVGTISTIIGIIAAAFGGLKWLYTLHKDAIDKKINTVADLVEKHGKSLEEHLKADEITRTEYERNVYTKIDRLQNTVESSSDRILVIQEKINDEILAVKKELMENKINNDELKKLIHTMNNVGQAVKLLIEKTKPLQEHYGKVLFLEKKFEELSNKKKAS